MFKDIVVIIDDVGERAAPCALALAKELGSYLTAVCVAPDTPFATFATAEVSYDMIAAAREKANDEARATVEAFAHQATRADMDIDSHVICDSSEFVRRRLLGVTRACDLVVIEQRQPDRIKPSDEHLETLLLHSARPTLIVPYVGVREVRFGKVTVAWDGSATAARAVRDAIPLLQRAKQVQIVHVAPEHTVADEPHTRLIRYLGRHGIESTFYVLPSPMPVADALLSHVADHESDLLVMGAYGHSRFMEALLGGASRTILESMTVPVLMSH